MGGIECSTHRLHNGKRLDMIRATNHDLFFRQDYQRLKAQGLTTIRSGIRWHLIEQCADYYDFSTVLPRLRAAHEMGLEVIWDLCHFGWPSGIDVFRPAFVDRLAQLARAFAEVVAAETDTTPFFCPINEISFLAWAGGDSAYLNPFEIGRGFELKVQLARAAIAAIEAVWEVLPQARFIHTDPIINIIHHPEQPHNASEAEGKRLAQYQAWDLLSGRLWPQIGGAPKYLDIIGVNYYPNNQWILHGPILEHWHPYYRPFYTMLQEVSDRYNCPIVIAETGTEGDARPDWLRYIMQEVSTLAKQGLAIEGMCLYPIFCHPGWDDERHCPNGLWDYVDDYGQRDIEQPLANELRHWQIQLQHL